MSRKKVIELHGFTIAGSEAMFADLGHFSYMAIQVNSATLLSVELFSHFQQKKLSSMVVLQTSLMHAAKKRNADCSILADCFHFSGISYSYTSLYGSSSLFVNASREC